MQPVAIFGAPRSGTSWVGQIFNSSPHVAYRFQPLFSYPFKSYLDEHSDSNRIESFHRKILFSEDDFVLQRQNVSGKPSIDFFKEDQLTHLVWKEVRYQYLIETLLKNSHTKVIGIVRHPCGVIDSWLRASREFDKGWDVLEEWKTAPKKNAGQRENYYGYEKWKELAFLFARLSDKFPHQFMVARYEDINIAPKQQVSRLFSFVALPCRPQVFDFIETSTTTHSDDAYDVFRRNHNVDLWYQRLPRTIRDSILNDPDFIRLNDFYQWLRP